MKNFVILLSLLAVTRLAAGQVKCDATHECPAGHTCCQVAGGQWGCCPLPQAVCCSDQVHCCPNGYTCHTTTGKCSKGIYSLPWFTKQAAIVNEPEKVEAVKCDATYECPDGHTCCQVNNGEWGCCPLPQAVCCDDHVHCCPNGYTCHTTTGKCNKGLSTLAWLEKQSAIVKPLAVQKKVEAVKCDATHECPDGHTCCQVAGGQWGCCPLPQAVCCSDQVHCCPNGYTCHTTTGKCNKGLSTLAWLEKQSAIVKPLAVQKKVEAVKCDATHECPDGHTCCQVAGGQWGCCPLPQAVCCSDQVHCCPNGYTCHTTTGKCNKGIYSLPWFTKQAAIVNEPEKVEAVKCDATHECPDGHTCCQVAGGQWGCCPLPQAVCCTDQVHCCPNGYTCHTTTGKCNKQGALELTWWEKLPARKRQ
ncbi:progranulin-like isoform X2 [Littorina saxatilis]|uniref:progranulin-like isoform X2 n=1 Tax=Littorina saxatilis TaxID=31220 RepID=UPI0038B6186A